MTPAKNSRKAPPTRGPKVFGLCRQYHATARRRAQFWHGDDFLAHALRSLTTCKRSCKRFYRLCVALPPWIWNRIPSLVRGFSVEHVLGEGSRQAHELT